jgi:hypothetical protein
MNLGLPLGKLSESRNCESAARHWMRHERSQTRPAAAEAGAVEVDAGLLPMRLRMGTPQIKQETSLPTLSQRSATRMTEPQTFESLLSARLEFLKQTLMQKRHDYGPGNLSRHGELGILVRISDKFERLNTLVMAGAEPNFESIDDTWLDIAGYATLALMLKEVGADDFARLPLREEAAR